MGIHYATFGRVPNDPPTVLWRVHDEMDPATTVLHGAMKDVPGFRASHVIEYDLMTLLDREHRGVWELIGECRQAVRPPATPPCGRLHCASTKRHTHRVRKPGDVVAMTAHDPRDLTAWPFPIWAVVGVPGEDDLFPDGICLDVGIGRHRRFSDSQAIRRLRPEEILLGPSTW